MTRDKFAQPYLVALYKEHRRNPQDRPSTNQLLQRYELPRDDYLEGELHEYLRAHGWASAPSVSSTLQDAALVISFTGKAHAERLLERGIDPVYLLDTYTGAAVAAPAAGRIVRFDHNSAEHKEIGEGIEQMREAARGRNDPDADLEERSRVVDSLAAAATLWKSSQLKAIQIKIGVLLALEDAAQFLSSTSKAAAANLLVDAVKAFLKTHSGIDLDRI